MQRAIRSVRGPGMLACLAALAVIAFGCGEPDDEIGAPTTTASTTTSASTTSAPSTTLPELPPCAPAAEFRRVPADWLPDAVPDGWELVHGATDVYRNDSAAGEPDGWGFFLAERLESNRLGLKLSVGARIGDYYSYEQLALDEPVLETVRGRPGSVGRWINRGDIVGVRMARWDEGGLHWSASVAPDALTNEELVALLDRLELSRDGVSDPTGVLTVLGTSRPEPSTEEYRYTRVVFRRAGAPVNEQVQIDVVAPVEGTEGVGQASGDQLLETDAGVAVGNGRLASARQPDGLGLNLETIDMSGHGRTPPLSMAEVEALALTPWSRVDPDDPDDPRRRSVPIADPDYSAEPIEACQE